ncbi:MAG: fused MFS/spermidine synthase [Victivallales bacterium]|nr:fused MFS/spermidine synthase [Victivallales bacterium]
MRQHVVSYLIAFLSGFAMMSFEMLGVRVLTPYYGGSIYVWGAIISVFLTGLGLGYAVGGRQADRDPTGRTLPLWLLLAAGMLLAFPVYGHACCRIVYAAGLDSRWGALSLSLLLFLLPCVCIGMVTPLLVKLRATAVGKVGVAAGDVYAASTAGSIAGTLFTSFFLITWIGVTAGIVLAGILLAAGGGLGFLAAPGSPGRQDRKRDSASH